MLGRRLKGAVPVRFPRQKPGFLNQPGFLELHTYKIFGFANPKILF